MIRGATPTIFVSDLQRAVDFYMKTLGLSLGYQAPGYWASISLPGGGQIGLHPASPKAPAPGTKGSIQIGFDVADISVAVAAFETRGVRFAGPVTDDGSVKLAFFNDPDGTELYLCQIG